MHGRQAVTTANRTGSWLRWLSSGSSTSVRRMRGGPRPVRTTTAKAAGELRTVSLPFFWPSSSLDTVAAEAPDKVWIGGLQGTSCLQPIPGFPCAVSSSGNPVVRRWTGSGWKEYPINEWSGSRAVRSVTAGGGETWIGALYANYLGQRLGVRKGGHAHR